MRRLAVLTALSVLSFAIPALRAEEPRALGAHEHGHGTLDIAIEGDTFAFELEVPAMDIVGFEHEASSKADKTAIEKAEITLAKGLALFELPEAAGCAQNDADIEVADVGHDGGDAEDGDGHEADGHNSFHAVYEFSCKSPGEVKRIGFAFFKAFPASAALSVTVVTPKGQSKFEVTRDKPEADLSGLM